MGGGVIRGDKLPKLISLIEGTQRGLNTLNNNEIISIINIIETENEDRKLIERVDGKWELLWTTEKETLFFIKYGLFGKQVTNIYQDINLNQNLINNQILFEDNREFSVLGYIEQENILSDKRINFNFKKAILKIPPLPIISIPPVGII